MAAKYCPQCAHEFVLKMEAGRERPVCDNCGFVMYRNPAPVALVLATREDKLLLVHRLNAPLAGYWAPPAGYIEMDESIEQGAVREVKEETGLEVVIDRLYRVDSRANMGVILLTFSGRITGGEMAGQDGEVDQVRFFAREELLSPSPPVDAKPLDYWFYELVEQVFQDFKRGVV